MRREGVSVVEVGEERMLSGDESSWRGAAATRAAKAVRRNDLRYIVCDV